MEVEQKQGKIMPDSERHKLVLDQISKNRVKKAECLWNTLRQDYGQKWPKTQIKGVLP